MRTWEYGAGGTMHYYAMDLPSANVRGLFNTSGNVTHSYKYSPFGQAQSTSEGTHNPLRFAARELDAGAGLYYVRARWYDPFLGRFLSEDPIGIEGGINTYAYALNDPVNLSDPSGLHHVCEQTSWVTGDLMAGTLKVNFVNGCWDFGHDPRSRFDDGDPPAFPSSCWSEGCRLRNPRPGSGEWEFVEETLDSIRQDNDFCAEVRARGIAAMYRDLRFWNHPVIIREPNGRRRQIYGNAPFDSRVGGVVLYFDARYLSRHYVVHEAVHTVPRRHSTLRDPTPYGDYSRTPLGSIDQTASYCLRSR